jgi:hypothetical protein
MDPRPGADQPDRLDPIGGALQVVSRKGGGTTIEGQIPTPKE